VALRLRRRVSLGLGLRLLALDLRHELALGSVRAERALGDDARHRRDPELEERRLGPLH
jgi:hypothetical protein